MNTDNNADIQLNVSDYNTDAEGILILSGHSKAGENGTAQAEYNFAISISHIIMFYHMEGTKHVQITIERGLYQHLVFESNKAAAEFKEELTHAMIDFYASNAEPLGDEEDEGEDPGSASIDGRHN